MGLLIAAPSGFAIAHLSPPDAMGSTAEHAALARLRDPPESEIQYNEPLSCAARHLLVECPAVWWMARVSLVTASSRVAGAAAA